MGLRARVDVVVVTHNSRDELRAAVEPLSRIDGVTTIVVDNASSDGTLETVAGLPVSRVARATNDGFAVGCNVGWRVGTAPHVLFLNPDAAIAEPALALLVDALEGDDGVGAVGPKILQPDGGLDYSQRSFPRVRTTFAQALMLHRFAPRATWSDEIIRRREEYDRTSSPDWLSGACLLVRRSVLEQLDGFDEAFFLYAEDTDLCRRIRDAGLAVLYVPDAVAIHEGGASAPRPQLFSVLVESRIRYARKHESPAGAFFERCGIVLNALTHTVLTRGGLQARLGHLRSLRVAFSTSGHSRHLPSRTASIAVREQHWILDERPSSTHTG
jgi:N-acetylglucosaminyl-diphospho-decaprenol L-rhamnosyltransferase